MLANAGLSAGQNIYQRVMTVVPLFLTVPKYFGGAITFGQVQSARDAFTQFSSNLSFIVTAYPSIAAQIANINRLKALDDAIDYERPRGIAFTPGGTAEGVAIRVAGLELLRPNGAPLLGVGEWTVRDGERWVIEGPSGTARPRCCAPSPDCGLTVGAGGDDACGQRDAGAAAPVSAAGYAKGCGLFPRSGRAA